MSLKIKAALAVTVILSPVLALDEFLPIGPRMMQVGVGMSRTSIDGDYGSDWASNEVSDPQNPLILPLQGKFGLMDGLEGSLGVGYIFEDRNGKTGLDRPVIALKYADSTTGAGGFLALTLPIGFEEILNAGNFATFSLGGLYGHRWGSVGLLANASYNYSTEDKDENKIDYLDLFAKPGYSLPLPALTSRNQDLQLNLGMRYDFWFNKRVNGQSVDDQAQLFSIHPGLFYTMNKIFGAELLSHFSISGQNQPAATTVELKLYFSLDESLYNAISG